VQREVIQTTLQDEYGLHVQYEQTQTRHVEKPLGTGAAFADRHDDTNMFEATLGLRVEPGTADSGITFEIGVGRGSLPVAFQKAIEETVHETLGQGLSGWEVTDCLVTVTHVGYDSVLTSGGDFRKLVPLILMESLVQAGTEVYEPLNRFEFDMPEGVFTQVLTQLTRAEARIDSAPVVLRGSMHVAGHIPVRTTFGFQRRVAHLTHGEGLFTTEFGGYQKVHGTRPCRARTDANPLNRQEYLRRVLKRE
jgi:ribosomal protection tetracycline resistance protein